jgi:hypothetical protein
MLIVFNSPVGKPCFRVLSFLYPIKKQAICK